MEGEGIAERGRRSAELAGLSLLPVVRQGERSAESFQHCLYSVHEKGREERRMQATEKAAAKGFMRSFGERAGYLLYSRALLIWLNGDPCIFFCGLGSLFRQNSPHPSTLSTSPIENEKIPSRY